MAMRSLLALVALVFAATTAAVRGQAGPSFDVASVKVNRNPDAPRFYQALNDRFTVGNVSLRLLIQLAYDVDPQQVVGGDAWVDDTRYDIAARASTAFAPPTEWQGMLRRLLADRFRLSVRSEARPAQVFALTLARVDGRFGDHLRRAAVACETLSEGAASGADACGLVAANRAGATGRMAVRGLRMARLASLLRSEVGQPVRDETGLAGTYDWELMFAPRRVATADADAPSIFTALQEQLGLKLEPRLGTLDVIVIDHAERPVED
jgi:uncharacterized protein (TIGR03435 family)